MPITALPTPPQRNDPANFATRGDAFMAALPTFTTEANALAADVNAKQVLATDAANAAAISEANALASETSATASAESALNAPGTSATSVSSIAVSAGTKPFTLAQTGKLYSVGQRLVFARTSAPSSTRLVGYLSAFNPGTGVGTLEVGPGDFLGTGTFTDWTVSLAGEGTNLPVPLTGDIGKILGVQVAGQYALVDGRGAGGTTPTAGNVTLTNLSSASQKLTAPSTPLPMQFVKLPDATTMPLGLGIFSLENSAGVDIEIRDNTSAAIGYIHPGRTVIVNLVDKATAAGTWSLVNAEIWGTLRTRVSVGGSATIQSVAAIDATRDLIVYASASGTSAIIWDNANAVFGTAVLISTTVPLSASNVPGARVAKLATDKMFVGITNSFVYGVVLTISGTTITPGTTATGANVGQDRFMDMVVMDNSTVVFAYGTSSTTLGVVAAVITGATVTFGTAVTTFAAAAFNAGSPASLFDLGSARFLLVGGTGAWAAVGTVSGAGVITMGTSATLPATSASRFCARKLPSGRFALISGAGGTIYGSILSISGSTITVTSATLVSGVLDVVSFAHVVGNQVLMGASANAAVAYFTVNVLTDNSGTAVAGTGIPVINTGGSNSTSSVNILGYDANTITVTKPGSNTSMASTGVYRLGISGNNPVVLSAQPLVSAAGGFPLPADPYAGSNATGGVFGRDTLTSGVVNGTRGAIDFGDGNATGLGWKTQMGYSELITRAVFPTLVPNQNYTNQATRGGSDSQIWAAISQSGTVNFLSLCRLKVV